jgi:hypothetical protein
MNPGNSLRELIRMMAPPANNSDLTRVASELQIILQDDPVLMHPHFNEAKSELTELLQTDKSAEKKKYEANKPLILAFSFELINAIQEKYICAALQCLDAALISSVDSVPEGKRWSRIQTITGNLLSTLIDRGSSVESLFQLYKQVISAPSKDKKTYVFEKRFDLLVKLITQSERRFCVTFAIDNISNTSDFPVSIGTVQFNEHPPIVKNPTPPVERYLSVRPKRFFASVNVETADYRAAGSEAYGTINDILDLVRFEYEREKIHLPDEFVITAGPPKNVYRIFPIPKVVPNPAAQVDSDGLQGLVRSVNELMANPGLPDDGRRRVQSAFRLYRVGADANIFENKLLSWWTAIEYLVKGSNSSGGIGDAVENTLAPVLCLGYVNKLLLSFRSALVDSKAILSNQNTGQTISLKELSASAIYELFKDPAQREHLLNGDHDPFLKYRLSEFLDALSTPQNTKSLLDEHERRLRWHIQRLYRARCDIVHSAERIVSASLLCANLEFYLKTTLTALLQSFRDIPHISGTTEFFDRQIYAHTKLVAELGTGGDKRLIALLYR